MPACECYFKSGVLCEGCSDAQRKWYARVTEENWRESRVVERPYKLPRPRPKVNV